MKKMMIMLFALLMVLAIQPLSIAANTEELDIYERWLPPSFFENQEKALMLHEEIWSAVPQTRAGQHLFPSYYGGHFIDGDGNLVVKLVETYDNAYDSGVLGNVLSNTNVSSQQVQFSYANLHHIFHFLRYYRDDNPDCEIIQHHVVWHKICVIGNRVVVGLYGDFEYLKKAFKNYIIDSPMITFQEGVPRSLLIGEPIELPDNVRDRLNRVESYEVGIAPLSFAIRPGNRIYIVDATGTRALPFSAGFGVSGASRFFTSPHNRFAGHRVLCPNLRDIGTLQSPVIFGNVTHSGLGTAGIDAGLVRADFPFWFDNTVDGHGLIGPGGLPSLGQVISVAGASTGIQRNRSIQNVHFDCPTARMVLVLTDATVSGGDSGGLVFRPFSTGSPTLMAHATGLVTSGTPGQRDMAFSRVDFINRQFGTSVQ